MRQRGQESPLSPARVQRQVYPSVTGTPKQADLAGNPMIVLPRGEEVSAGNRSRAPVTSDAR
jgi:hypothetical protein